MLMMILMSMIRKTTRTTTTPTTITMIIYHRHRPYHLLLKRTYLDCTINKNVPHTSHQSVCSTTKPIITRHTVTTIPSTIPSNMCITTVSGRIHRPS
mmetsp:Transcript_34192/g.57453  ORF Transcript_34192/g.57453 Transcript_34192/m.57453 type:complete len:97 (-) Transcript_34192:140-430(-)